MGKGMCEGRAGREEAEGEEAHVGDEARARWLPLNRDREEAAVAGKC